MCVSRVRVVTCGTILSIFRYPNRMKCDHHNNLAGGQLKASVSIWHGTVSVLKGSLICVNIWIFKQEVIYYGHSELSTHVIPQRKIAMVSIWVL